MALASPIAVQTRWRCRLSAGAILRTI